MIKLTIIQNCHIILASISVARKKLLSDLGLEFEVIRPDFDEELAKPQIRHLQVKEQAIYLAKQKALSISIKYPNSITIGSDQICSIDGLAINKSKNISEAIEQLQLLRGKTHIQNNAVCLYRGKKLLFRNFSKATLTLRDLSDKQITNYVHLDKSFGCAGSYKFESFGKHLFSKVSGCDSSIIGMNVLPLINFLHKHQLISL